MARYLKLFIIVFALTFTAMAILDLSSVKQYIQAQANQARQIQMRIRYYETRGL